MEGVYDNIVLMYSAMKYHMSGYGLQGVLEYLKQYYGNPPIYIHENGTIF
jgi:beta-glucosidase/6-phospho-beta-glucosidase/beta-galactosidase